MWVKGGSLPSVYVFLQILALYFIPILEESYYRNHGIGSIIIAMADFCMIMLTNEKGP